MSVWLNEASDTVKLHCRVYMGLISSLVSFCSGIREGLSKEAHAKLPDKPTSFHIHVHDLTCVQLGLDKMLKLLNIFRG